jgi:tetratricopeptide (TPR) repeat protein
MPISKIDANIRRFRWEASKRARRTGRISGAASKKALQLHIEGRYEEAIAEIEQIPLLERSAEAWRVLGLAEHGKGNFEAALAAHDKSFRLHGGDPAAAAEDQENIAAVFTTMNDYEEAWGAADRAAQLAPRRLMTWIAKISILNRQAKREQLQTILRQLLAENPHVLQDPFFNDHLNNDTDFIGVQKLINSLTAQKGANHD